MKQEGCEKGGVKEEELIEQDETVKEEERKALEK